MAVSKRRGLIPVSASGKATTTAASSPFPAPPLSNALLPFSPNNTHLVNMPEPTKVSDDKTTRDAPSRTARSAGADRLAAVRLPPPLDAGLTPFDGLSLLVYQRRRAIVCCGNRRPAPACVAPSLAWRLPTRAARHSRDAPRLGRPDPPPCVPRASFRVRARVLFGESERRKLAPKYPRRRFISPSDFRILTPSALRA